MILTTYNYYLCDTFFVAFISQSVDDFNFDIILLFIFIAFLNMCEYYQLNKSKFFLESIFLKDLDNILLFLIQTIRHYTYTES